MSKKIDEYQTGAEFKYDKIHSGIRIEQNYKYLTDGGEWKDFRVNNLIRETLHRDTVNGLLQDGTLQPIKEVEK